MVAVEAGSTEFVSPAGVKFLSPGDYGTAFCAVPAWDSVAETPRLLLEIIRSPTTKYAYLSSEDAASLRDFLTGWLSEVGAVQ